MTAKTYTVVSGYVSRDGRTMVFLRGMDRPVEAERAFGEGEAVRLVAGKAVAR